MMNPVKLYRFYHWLYLRRIRLLPGLLQRINFGITGCDLPPSVKIGARPQFKHYGMGVVLHHTVEMGDDVIIMPHVVLGQKVKTGQEVVRLERIVIGNKVLLGAGAKIIAAGHLEIGDGASVGANAVVLQSVPPGTAAVGIPAKIIHPRTATPT